jgi:hypothetical protein
MPGLERLNMGLWGYEYSINIVIMTSNVHNYSFKNQYGFFFKSKIMRFISSCSIKYGSKNFFYTNKGGPQSSFMGIIVHG